MKKLFLVSSIISISFLFSACSANNPKDSLTENKQVTKKDNNKKTIVSLNNSFYIKNNHLKIEHIHGTGYPGNMNGFVIATHNGIKIYNGQDWYETKENNNDYMGFQATTNGFFASGHPESNSNLKNPLGLVKSVDGGKTISPIKFYGVTDFHNMSVGYFSHDIFVFNQEKNSELDTGFYISKNEGESWKQIIPKGLPNSLNSFSLHPSKTSLIAMNSNEGLYLSTDEGKSFSLISSPSEINTSTFSDKYLYYIIFQNGKKNLQRYDLVSNQTSPLSLPELSKDDMVMFISINPKDERKMTFTTMKNKIFQSLDEGKTWKEIL
ncbi:VPS10, VPS10 domain protein [Bacillus sp. RG28]|uniref:VPS10, VPS10 domain protein n=1 Tax=Gottfriedia endophytica TaxID=2820819 RepID=A0A940SK96_9BACI|nr:VPS10, VPS10 domain protein [Gottfriedia endophytica]MBP0726845.1 VPS10, VPS10 domain protein [Gottfriedia endophytica]